MNKIFLYCDSWGTHFSSCSWVEGRGTALDGFRSGKVVEDSVGASRYAGDFRGKKQIEVTGERTFCNILLSMCACESQLSTLDKISFPQPRRIHAFFNFRVLARTTFTKRDVTF